MKAWQTLTEPNIKDSLAVDARMELDLRIGVAFTRFQTIRFQKKFQGLSDSVVSYGRVLRIVTLFNFPFFRTLPVSNFRFCR
jgi:DNA topoisomerase IA